MCRSLAQLLAISCIWLTIDCSGRDSAQPSDKDPVRHDTTTGGADSTLDVASWNLEWFGDLSNGPADEALQLQNVSSVILGANMDIWGLTEIVSSTQWEELKTRLPEYSGILASDAAVIGGADHYDATEQKVGILFKVSSTTVEDSRLILSENEADFGGRPPLQARLRITVNGVSRRVVMIVIHSKCCQDGWQQRVNASNALKAFLDESFPTQLVFVVGDFNDDLDTSIVTARPSPYVNFAQDTLNYALPTAALSAAHVSTTVNHQQTIDHHLITNELGNAYIAASAQVYRADLFIRDYGLTTSDHYPVLTRYRWGTFSTGADSNPCVANAACGDSGCAPDDIGACAH